MYPDWLKQQAAHFLRLASKRTQSYEKCLLFIDLLNKVYILVTVVSPELSAIICRSFIGICNKISLWYEGMYESHVDIFEVIFSVPLFDPALQQKIESYKEYKEIEHVKDAITKCR